MPRYLATVISPYKTTISFDCAIGDDPETVAYETAENGTHSEIDLGEHPIEVISVQKCDTDHG